MLKVLRLMLIPLLGIFLFFGFVVKDVFASNLLNGLAGYWILDNGATVDISGNNNNLINSNAVVASGVLGIENTAFDFENSNSSHLYITDNNQKKLDIASSTSVSSWVNFESLPKVGDIHIITSKYNENINERSYIFSVSNDHGGGYEMQSILSSAGSNYTKLYSPNFPFILNTWYNLSWVYDSLNGVMKFYVDGVKIGETSGGPRNIYNSKVTFQIGGYDPGYSGFFFDGIIDEVRIYDRVLTEEEIKELYDQFKGVEEQDPFSFVHVTDPHIGSSWVPGHKWYEELSYPRFTDVLYEIGDLMEKPDFILVSGDTVEYANERWLKDYRSLTDSFTAQTGIGVHTVPGNHDRFRTALGSTPCALTGTDLCDDNLEAYKANVFPTQDEYFTHKGVEFIGLDSGADFLPDYEKKDLKGDKGIESEGLADDQIMALRALDTEKPKVLYMHSPIFTGGQDEYGNGYLEDASIANNRDEFLGWASSSNLQLALTGHSHRDEVYDESGYQYLDLANAENRPLFIQTQSATHDSETAHGYRVIKFADNTVNPLAVSETGEHIKIISQLKDGANQELRVFDPLVYDKFVTPQDKEGLTVPFFAAEDSKRILVYGETNNKIKLQVWQKDFDKKEFDLSTRIEGLEMETFGGNKDFGYQIGDLLDGQFVHFYLENKLASLEAKNISFLQSDKYQFKVDFGELIKTKNISNLVISKDFQNGADIALPLTKMKHSIIAKLFSPAELYIENIAGERTGIINHESVEEIDYSVSDEERERVLLYSQNNFAGENFIYRIKGIEDIFDEEKDEFSLKIAHTIDDVIDQEINIVNMPINASTTYQFRVDWENLSVVRGVIMEIDKNGDGVFEIKVELGKEINNASPYGLRKDIIQKLSALKTGEIMNDAKLGAVIDLINKSLNDKWWLNDYYLQKNTGENVFRTDLLTIIKIRLFLGLDFIMDNKNIPDFIQNKLGLSTETVEGLKSAMDDLLRSDLIISQISINDFRKNIVSEKMETKLRLAEKKLGNAINLADNKQIQYLEFCKQAWVIVN